MPLRSIAAQVVPIVPHADRTQLSGPADWLLELQPASSLPEVDLSVSLRSRFLTKTGFAWAVRITRHGRIILIMFAVGVAMVTIVFYLRHTVVRQILAPLALALMLPSTIAGIGVLRYDMVRLLLRTYDVWFSLVCSSLCFMTLALEFADVRAAIPFVIWSSMHINVFVDANLRGVKRMTMMNLAAATSMSCALVAMKLGFTTDLQPFAFVRRGPWELAAEDVVSSAGATSIALVMRNVARFRASLGLGTNHQVLCVSYRCTLRIVPAKTQHPSLRVATPTAVAVDDECANVPPVQRLLYVPHFDHFDPRHTLIMLTSVNQQVARVSGLGAFALSVASTCFAYSRSTHSQWKAGETPRVLSLMVVSILATSSLAVVCIGSFQRQLITALVSSFDFAYLSIQLTFVHLVACDYFRWSIIPCLALLNSWLWIHWVMCVDALSPSVKNGLRVHARFPAVVLSTWFVGWIMLQHHIVVVDTAIVPYDRVLWSETILGHQVTVRAMPLFFNCMATLMAWLLRLLYRTWTFDSNMLIMLDGRVAYVNYMIRGRVPGHRRERIVSRLWTDVGRVDSRSGNIVSAF